MRVDRNPVPLLFQLHWQYTRRTGSVSKSNDFGSSRLLKRHVASARCRRIWSCCVCKTDQWRDLLPPFVFSLRFQVMSQPRRSTRLAARFQSVRSSPRSQPPQPMAIDLTDTEPISDGLSDDLVLSEVEMLPAPSCFVCDGHFTSSGPLSRCVLQCCPISVHLQCVTDLVHLPSRSVVCPACNSQSPSSLDFFHFQHLCCVRHVEAPAGECMICSSPQTTLLPFLFPSQRMLGSVSPRLRRPLPF